MENHERYEKYQHYLKKEMNLLEYLLKKRNLAYEETYKRFSLATKKIIVEYYNKKPVSVHDPFYFGAPIKNRWGKRNYIKLTKKNNHLKRQ